MLTCLDLSPNEMRRKALRIRQHVIKMISARGKGHTGPALSMVEIVTALYFGVLQVDPENPRHPGRDRFLLSKGHACTALYAALAERGYFPVSRLDEYYRLDSLLGGHPVNGLPGIEASTGSLGHGLPMAVGMALSAKLNGQDHRIFTVLGDGENQEGSVWEAAMAAAHYKTGPPGRRDRPQRARNRRPYGNGHGPGATPPEVGKLRLGRPYRGRTRSPRPGADPAVRAVCIG